MKKLISTFIVITSVLFISASCAENSDPCACYDKALSGSELSEECKTIVGDLSEEEIKEKSNECFGQAIEDLSGAAGI
jgi:hypothetical protein